MLFGDKFDLISWINFGAKSEQNEKIVLKDNVFYGLYAKTLYLLPQSKWRKVVSATGFEPVTHWLKVNCSTNWATRPKTTWNYLILVLESSFMFKNWVFFYIFLFFIATLTFAGTNDEISPPKSDISLTNLDATNWWFSEAVKKIVSISFANLAFIPAIWNS